MAVPIFHSLLTHLILICLLITMPLYSGKLDALSLQSLPVFLEDSGGHPEILYVRSSPDQIFSEADDPDIVEERDQQEQFAATDAVPDVRKAAAVFEDKDLSLEEIFDPVSASEELEQEQKELSPPAPQMTDGQIKLLSGDIGGTRKDKKPELEMAVAAAPPKQIAKLDASESESIKPIKLNTPAVERKTEEEVSSKEIVPVEKKTDVDRTLQHESIALKKSEKPGPIPLPEEEKAKEIAGPDMTASAAKESPHGIRRANDDVVATKPESEPESQSAVSNPSGDETKKGPASDEKAGQKSRSETEVESAGLTKKNEAGRLLPGSAQSNGAKGGQSKPSEGWGKEISVSKPAVSQAPTKGTSINNGGDNAKKEAGGLSVPEKASGSLAGKSAASDEQPKIAQAAIPVLHKSIPVNDEKMGLGLPRPEPPVLADIKIEISLVGKEDKLISMYLLKKGYPVHERKPQKNRKEDINYPVQRQSEQSDPSGVKHIISVTKAEKGTFTFVIDNKGRESCSARVVFHIYEGRKEGRIKEYKTVEMHPDEITRFRFILPDAIFWDDNDRFSGEIESSNTRTKFNYESGLVWTEEKE